MHREGRTQEAIGAELDVPRDTVDAVIRRISEKRSAAKSSKPKQREAPPLAIQDPPADSSPAPVQAPAETAEPSYRINLAPRGYA
jgi:hypothetical protein